MGRHVVLGAGAVGRATAAELVASGHEVLLVSRSGGGADVAGVRAVAADVTDRARLIELARGAQSVVNALNPAQYHRWQELWPPMATAVLAAAEASGAGLVTVANLYLYGRVSGPMTEQAPVKPAGHKGEVRARMWNDALAAHESGRVRATEVRASDYVGPGIGAQSFLNSFVIAPALKGRTPWLVMGDPDAPHTWTSGADVARLVARLATESADSDAWGRPWHVPSAEARSMAQVAAEAAALAGRGARRPRRIPKPVMETVGVFHPLLRELKETRHQFEGPFLLDSSAAQESFGLAPTPWDITLKETVAYLQAA